MALPSSDQFLPHVGKPIRFGVTELELRLVDARSAHGFTLILSGPKTPVLPEGSHEASVAGQSLGAIYVMPIHTRADSRQDYQAVFN